MSSSLSPVAQMVAQKTRLGSASRKLAATCAVWQRSTSGAPCRRCRRLVVRSLARSMELNLGSRRKQSNDCMDMILAARARNLLRAQLLSRRFLYLRTGGRHTSTQTNRLKATQTEPTKRQARKQTVITAGRKRTSFRFALSLSLSLSQQPNQTNGSDGTIKRMCLLCNRKRA